MPGSASDYEVVSEIGTGSFGKCCLVCRKRDGQQFVWKEVNYGQMREGEKESLVREVNLLRELNHPHIVRYVDRIVNKHLSTLYLVMEYCAGGDLSQLISERKEMRIKGKTFALMDESFVLKVFNQLLLALKELHCNDQRRILHRDLKPANVFLTEPLGDVKLGDFGLARVLERDVSMAVSYVGTPYYMSPEQVNGQQYNEASDIWSLGCLIYELCALHPPFTASNQKQLYSKIKNGSFRRIPHQYCEDLHLVISQMLKQSAKHRPSVEYLLGLPLLNGRKRSETRLPRIVKSSTPTKPSTPKNSTPKIRRSASSGYSSAISNVRNSTDTEGGAFRRGCGQKSLESNNNVALVKASMSEDDLFLWERRLREREEKANERESLLDKREDELRRRESELERKSRVLQPVVAPPLANNNACDQVSRPFVRLQNRLIPLSIRHKASKLRRSPSDPIKPKS